MPVPNLHVGHEHPKRKFQRAACAGVGEALVVMVQRDEGQCLVHQEGERGDVEGFGGECGAVEGPCTNPFVGRFGGDGAVVLWCGGTGCQTEKVVRCYAGFAVARFEVVFCHAEHGAEAVCSSLRDAFR